MDIIRKVFAQTSWQLFGKAVTSLSTVIVLGFITRTYGEEGTGVYTLALSFLALFFLAVDLGLNACILPQLAGHPSFANKLFNLRLVISATLVVIANITAYLYPSPDVFFYSVFLGSMSIVCFGIFNSSNLIFQQKLKYQLSMVASATGAVVIIPVVFVMTRLNLPIEYIALGPMLGWVINNLLALILVSRYYVFTPAKLDPSFLKQTLKVNWPISLTLLLSVAYFRVDSFILNSIKSISEVGVYNIAFQVFQTAIVVPTFIMNSYYPLMIETMHKDRENFFKQLKIAGMMLFLISLIGTGFVYLLSPMVVRVITGGGFEGASSTLRILSLGFPAYFLSSLLIWTYMALGMYKRLVFIYFVGLVSNIVLNLIFIPQYSYLAAAAVTGFSEYLILILQISILIYSKNDTKSLY